LQTAIEARFDLLLEHLLTEIVGNAVADECLLAKTRKAFIRLIHDLVAIVLVEQRNPVRRERNDVLRFLQFVLGSLLFGDVLQ
jgi:hypothetical protein